MSELSWTLPVVGEDEEGKRLLTPEEVWRGLLRKAENPVPFIAGITDCRVLERHEDGLLREITVAGRAKARERAVFHDRRLMVFHQLDDPYLAEIRNEIGHDGQGATTLTIRVVLSAEGKAKGEQDASFVASTAQYFGGIVQPIIDTIVRMREELTPRA
ncbi:SRPBCC family protein [Streptomyces sp. NBC_00335]|uniref:SRPBCC family protein n=1 Tax=unclassified Streptomyces TaxID=2593676 RepID=UPI002251629B|nr:MULTISPECIES: SRPBCC family protein [unclassified Streptomyces]MCX5405567.1 SRPBCC family protein [Streptomyces sp. NBC_00086]